jgi:hypothetical protein
MRHKFSLPLACVLLLAGCHSHPLTDYRPLDQAGMFSSNIEELKGQNLTNEEIAQVVKLKNAGISDENCVELVRTAHSHQHLFLSADSASSLAGAGFSDQQILDIARADKLDSISIDAVTLKLIGLSDATVQMVLKKRIAGQRVMASAEISQLKNTGLSERQIVERINAGETDEQAEKEIRTREAVRNHSNTSFVRIHGRKPQ